MSKRPEVQATCPEGHAQRWWGSPLMVERGTVPRAWGGPILCGECGRELGVQR